ncbi:MAG: TolC family protein [Bacteroidota bacterium]
MHDLKKISNKKLSAYLVLRFPMWCFVFLFFNPTTNAQYLEDYLRQATENHVELKSAYQKWQASLKKIPQETALPDPTVSVGYFILPIETRLGPQQAKFSINQQFPWFGTLKAREKLAVQQADLEYTQLAVIKNNLLFDVKQYYFELYELQQKIKLEKLQLEILQSMENITLQAYENNTKPLTTLLELQMAIRESNTHINNLLSTFKSKTVAFAETIGNTSPSKQRLVINLPDTLIPAILVMDFPILLESAKKNNPQAQVLLQTIENEDKKLYVVKHESRPKIIAGIDYGILEQRTDANPEDNGRNILMPQLSVTLPVFNKAKYQALQQETILNKESKQSEYKSFLNDLEVVLYQAWSDYKIAESNLQLIQEQHATLTQIERLTISRFSNTEVDYVEMLDIKLAKIDLEKARATQLVKMATSKALLEKLSGIAI